MPNPQPKTTETRDESLTNDAESEHNLAIVVGALIGGIFFVGLGGGVVFPTLPALGTILGISPFMVGIILSMSSFSRLIANTPVGQVIDRLGARIPLILGIGLGGLASFGYILALHAHLIPLFGSPELFILSRAIWGIGSAFVFVGGFGTIIHITTEETRGKWVGYFRGGQALGFPSGLVLGGVVTDFYGYEAAFALAGFAGLVGCTIGYFFFPSIKGNIKEPAPLGALPGMVRADIRVLVIGYVNFTIRLLYVGVLLSTIVLYLGANQLALGWIGAVGASGLFLAIAAIFSAGTTIISGNMSDYVGNRTLIATPALGIFAVGFFVLAIEPSLTGVMVGVACIGIGVGGTNPPLLAYLGDISPKDDVGKLAGAYNVFGDLGSSIGPLVAVPLGAIIGYGLEYFLSASMTMIVAFIVFYLLVKRKSPPSI